MHQHTLLATCRIFHDEALQAVVGLAKPLMARGTKTVPQIYEWKDHPEPLAAIRRDPRRIIEQHRAQSQRQ